MDAAGARVDVRRVGGVVRVWRNAVEAVGRATLDPPPLRGAPETLRLTAGGEEVTAALLVDLTGDGLDDLVYAVWSPGRGEVGLRMVSSAVNPDLTLAVGASEAIGEGLGAAPLRRLMWTRDPGGRWRHVVALPFAPGREPSAGAPAWSVAWAPSDAGGVMVDARPLALGYGVKDVVVDGARGELHALRHLDGAGYAVELITSAR